jgi:hypothetical protein
MTKKMNRVFAWVPHLNPRLISGLNWLYDEVPLILRATWLILWRKKLDDRHKFDSIGFIFFLEGRKGLTDNAA